MKLSGSILAVNGNYMEYAKQLRYVNVDCLHIDVFSGTSDFTLNDLLKFDDSFLPLDVHLIFESITDEDIDILNQANISYLNVQYENLLDKNDINRLYKRLRSNFGIAYTSRTPLNIIEENVKVCSQILFMCSEPGVSGAQFDESNYERIRKFHMKYPQLEIVADGGIDRIKAKKLDSIGVSTIVSGSFLCGDLDAIDLKAFELKYYDSVDVTVDNKMIPVALLPIVSVGTIFKDIMNKMNRYRLGMVFVVDSEELVGIVSDGDIRRGFIKYDRDIFDKTAGELLNSKPYKAEKGTRIREIYNDLANMHKGIEVIPITDGNKFIGALDLKLGK